MDRLLRIKSGYKVGFLRPFIATPNVEWEGVGKSSALYPTIFIENDATQMPPKSGLISKCDGHGVQVKLALLLVTFLTKTCTYTNGPLRFTRNSPTLVHLMLSFNLLNYSPKPLSISPIMISSGPKAGKTHKKMLAKFIFPIAKGLTCEITEFS